MASRTRTDRTRNDKGRYQQEYTDEEILEAVEEIKIAATTEVAEAVGGHHNQVRERLRELEGQGEVICEDKARTLIWQISDGGRE